MADQGLHVGATGFGFMTAAMGVGAVAGGLFVAARGKTGLRPLILAAAGFGVTMAVATLAPTLAVELIALALVGAGSIAFMSTGNSTLQLNAAPEMRGRVMSLWFVAFQGSTPIGGPGRRGHDGHRRPPRRPRPGRDHRRSGRLRRPAGAAPPHLRRLLADRWRPHRPDRRQPELTTD